MILCLILFIYKKPKKEHFSNQEIPLYDDAAIVERNNASEAISRANEAKRQADEARSRANEAKRRADEAKRQADEARSRANAVANEKIKGFAFAAASAVLLAAVTAESVAKYAAGAAVAAESVAKYAAGAAVAAENAVKAAEKIISDKEIKFAELNKKYNLYKTRIYYYDTFVSTLNIDVIDFNKIYNSLNLNFDDNILNDFNEKLQYYKVKSIDLHNNIELLKNTNVLNYYIILIIYVGFIFLIIGAICLILYPNKLYLIIISLTIIFIITLIILLIKMHKNTNMDNDKNYWSNFNPSDSTALFNDDGLT